MQKVLCFGTFDGIHDGHRSMLREAKQLGSRDEGVGNSTPVQESATGTSHLKPQTYLIVAVAPDSVVTKLKGKAPRHNSAQRITMLKSEKIADEVTLAEETVGTWAILKKYKPAVIALGYDQDELRSNLENYLEKAYPELETEEGWQSNPKKPKIVILSAHKPETHHNSKMRNRES